MRPRTRDRHLPPCVYWKHGAFWLVRKGKWIRLGAKYHEALVAYAKATAPSGAGVPGLIDKALPFITEGRAQSTIDRYEHAAGLVKEVFRDRAPDQVRHGDVVEMLDGFSDRRALANRMLTVLRMVYQWALDRQIVEADPTVSVKRFKQTARDRLISDAEYKAIYAKCAPWLQIVVDICYLTGQRIGDVLTIERTNLRDDGIYFKQQKTGKQLIVAWTPELNDAVKRAKALGGAKSVRYLLAGRGGRLRLHSNVWRAFKTAARKANVPNVTLHDLRAMSGTEAEKQGSDPTALLGHTDRRTTRSYLRDKTPRVVVGPRKKAS